MFLTPIIKKASIKPEPPTDPLEDNRYLPRHLIPGHKRSLKVLTRQPAKTPQPKSPKSKTLSKTQTSFSFMYKPQHIQGKSFKLPAVSDLLNLSPK